MNVEMKKIKLNGKDIEVRELTVAQLRQVQAEAARSAGEGKASMVDMLCVKDGITEKMICLSTGLGPEQFDEMTPSGMDELVEAVRETNKSFLAKMGIPKQEGREKGIGQRN